MDALTFPTARTVPKVFLVAILILLASCGGGGGDSSPPPPPAPSGLSYSAPPPLTVGHAMTALNPTVTGSVTGYAVSPALPAGLSINNSSGVISGTPTAVTPTATYTVTASNSTGNATATLSIVVNDVAPAVSYGSTSLTFTADVPIREQIPQVTGGTPTSWSIAPALPAGLTFDTANGRISGTPTAVVASASHTVTATNSGGQAQATFTVGVESGVLIDLGHAGAINKLLISGSRALIQSLGPPNRWVLWNLATADRIASGDVPCADPDPILCTKNVHLAGPTFVIETPSGMEVRASSDGHLLSTISAPKFAHAVLASDGSYVVLYGVNAGFSVWSLSGNLMFERTTGYGSFVPFAAPGELRIARGAAGPSVIETFAVPAGTATPTPTFAGEFHSWFTDGERFLTTAGNTVAVYSKGATRLDLTTLPNVDKLTGQGDWFWINYEQGVSPTVALYKVGASATPTASYSPARALHWGPDLALLMQDTDTLKIVDLSSPTLTTTSHTIPAGTWTVHATDETGTAWLLGDSNGVVLDGTSAPATPRYFGFGAALSISGSTSRVVIATASGRILYFNADTKALEGELAFKATQTALSSSGTVLAAAAAGDSGLGTSTDRSIRIYSLPDGAETYRWTYSTAAPPYPHDITLSASGTVLAQTLGVGPGLYHVTGLTGAPDIWQASSSLHDSQPIRLSPNGTQLAAPVSDSFPGGASTELRTNGALSAAVVGWPLGWIDDHRLLADRFDNGPYVIYNESGMQVGTVQLPPSAGRMRTIQPLTSDSIYSPDLNEIFALGTGQVLWSSPTPKLGPGAVAGSRVYFMSGAVVRAEPY